MHYLSISKSGIWQFRYQVSSQHRHLFDGCREIKRSLKTSNKDKAILLALELEIQVRSTILNPTKSVTTPQVKPLPPKNILSSSKLTRKKGINTLPPEKALERFCRYKTDHISPKAIGMLKAKCQIVLGLLTKSQLTSIRRCDAEYAVQLLRQYPVNMKKYQQFKGMTGKDAIKLNQKLKMATLSEESVKDYSQKMSGFFEWCVLNELTDINPFKAIRFKKTRQDSEAKNAYSFSDLRKVFNTEIHTLHTYKHPHYYWLPLLAYFTGARLNELCQLYTADIQTEYGIWFIQIDDRLENQKLKNLTSRRKIPIHNKLIELGFIEFVKSISHDRVFPELKDSRDGFGSAASKWYGRFKTKLGFNKGHDFHSFRHTVATQLKQQQVSHIIAGAILGHTQNNITYDRYGKAIGVQQMKGIIELIDSSPLDNLVRKS